MSLAMPDLAHRYEEWVANAKRQGAKFVAYKCPNTDCGRELETLRVTPEDAATGRLRYDSLNTCPYCGDTHWKVVRYDGRVDAVRPGKDQEPTHV